ncbi:MAG: hypothetical protein LBK44_06400, partial [Spirochaetales bacterium]|nr:hypothetical protein [Spirochaetales bacterium]
MKKFRYTIMSALITALALFVLSCSTGGDDDDYTPPYTPPDTLPGPVEVEASGSITLPAPLLSNGTTAVIPLDPVGGFTLTVMLELSGGSTYRLHLTVSGKEYLLSCVSVGESNPLATAWTLT